MEKCTALEHELAAIKQAEAVFDWKGKTIHVPTTEGDEEIPLEYFFVAIGLSIADGERTIDRLRWIAEDVVQTNAKGNLLQDVWYGEIVWTQLRRHFYILRLIDVSEIRGNAELTERGRDVLARM